MELVFAADLHLAATTWKHTPGVTGDSHRAFEQIVTYCADHKDRVAALALGGDIFDAKPEPKDVYCFLKGIRLLAKLGVKVLAIQGQHGRNREMPWTSIDPYVNWLHGSVVELPGPIHISGFDNLPPGDLQEALKGLHPSVDILVVHQRCKGCLPDIDGAQNWDFDPEWVPPHVKLVLMGDIHKAWEVVLARTVNGVKSSLTCVYSGSTCLQDITESPDKSFLVVSLDGKYTYRREAIKNRPFVTLVLNSEGEFAQALEGIGKLAPETLVLIRHDSRIVDIEQRLKAVNDKVHYILRLLPLDAEPSTTLAVGEAVSLEKVTLQDCLTKVVDPAKEPVLHSMLTKLLESKEPAITLEELKKEFIDGSHSVAEVTDVAKSNARGGLSPANATEDKDAQV